MEGMRLLKVSNSIYSKTQRKKVPATIISFTQVARKLINAPKKVSNRREGSRCCATDLIMLDVFPWMFQLTLHVLSCPQNDF